MAIYSSRILPERHARILKVTRIWTTVIAFLTLLTDAGLRNHYNLGITSHGMLSRLLEAGFIGPIVILVQMWSPWRGGFKSLSEAARQSYSLTIANDEVVLESQGTMRRFAIREIVRAEEPRWGAGLYLRTTNRYRWQVIRKSLDGYSEAKDEIRSLGIPIVRTTILPNWEEFVAVGVFCGSLFCDMLITSRPLLLANLVIAVLLGIGGWYVVNASLDNRKTRRLARIGTWLPAVCAAVALYFTS